ncbi:DNA/pantothenate metabolism flavoprotein, C-terminal [Kalmanozyma brasiliensis GHG001]|uniref:Phosphopantothenate-cysteine ligase n=1 Tax=Kalmanozyma brasiliensis (strain GHG001) TaxID=1365824 RepID=V5E941_KALBG|nr:DNA/pantothenate metabolism flavoprotein, C-terminal [Kalmanozyma brasiliensis GHG001]EST06871.1 DNA/pantothenate metabolism flavoprotein, C-terminal [Kalmanozyma brasiliensis GHG001]
MSDPSASSSSSPQWSSDRFFQTQAPPPNLSELASAASEFVQRHIQEGRKVVLVTSGGTTVPLEKNVVRFLDNFSAGTRGATSAEYFLSAGYAVIFMSRQHSLAPYTRHYSHTTNPFLDLLADPATHVHTDSPASASGEDNITVLKQHVAHLRPILSAYHHARTSGLLHTVPFVTVNDYLWLLREMSRVMQPLGRYGMYYLAAAVSDFFIPSTSVPEHKIQSGKGSLVIEMDQVPKVLKPMVEQWVPEGYLVSFKLETDPKLLIPKAVGALQRYGHQLVIGNDLNRRKFEVVFVERKAHNPVHSSEQEAGPKRPAKDISVDDQQFTATWMRLVDSDSSQESNSIEGGGKGGEKELEEDIIRELCRRHDQWIAKSTSAASSRI